jgi:hypothetical protein
MSQNNELPVWYDEELQRPEEPLRECTREHRPDGWCTGCSEFKKDEPTFECSFPCELRVAPKRYEKESFVGMLDDGTIVRDAKRVRCDAAFWLCRGCCEKANRLCEQNEVVSVGYDWYDLWDGVEFKMRGGAVVRTWMR